MDIFSSVKRQPKLYIVDLSLRSEYKSRRNSKKSELVLMRIEKIPIMLHEGKLPSNNYRKKLIKRLHENYIKKGNFDNSIITITKIENITFSSKLSYRFDYDVD